MIERDKILDKRDKTPMTFAWTAWMGATIRMHHCCTHRTGGTKEGCTSLEP